MVRGRRSVSFPEATTNGYRARLRVKKTEEAAHVRATPSRWHSAPPSLHVCQPARGSASVVAPFQSSSKLEVLKSMVFLAKQERHMVAEYSRSSTKSLCGSVDEEQVDASKQDGVQLRQQFVDHQ
ncbi:hypothetical protein SETIT_2G155100v2 [Setaria italica]|uniref:Uncharacterized protein n=1 Tax=Setaria italica TaxID=4555 RepID=A0A368PYZ9_SETIT|nr:hypothetical protein SETIT_2G155100v2 [Setaria italica]